MGKRLLPPSDGGGDHIEPVDLKKALEERYLAYALSTIMHRALPDVRDGLKPVHRRIMHAMRLLRLNPDQGFAKCARIVGEVMGKFHPHGDQSIYDALVRLAQDFSMRYPLVDGQGNFGNIDGDNAAAMRYTEARMTDVATELLAGITEDAVDYRPTYNEEDEEPVVLPGAFPNLLANGSSGIAVGMATSIPPHNAAELCDAALHLIENPDAPVTALMDFVQGPDFPTGGIVLGRSGIYSAYSTGRGSIVMRGKVNIEQRGNDRESIIITEVPYQVNKASMIEKMAELVRDKRVEGISDIRDESDRQGYRVVIELKRDAVADVVLNQLYRFTPLQTSFGANMVALN
ncbi:MAG: DNA topoisomerase IV subunit A, partial [Mesorhizobium sp.]